MNKVKMQFGDNLRKIRENLKLSQQDFAEDLNEKLKGWNIKAKYDNKTISNWESAVSLPNLDVIIAIAKEYKFSLDELLKSRIDNLNNYYRTVNKGNSNCLEDFKKFKNVCVQVGDEFVSSWNPKNYKYGMLSYFADSLINAEKNFDNNENTFKTCEVLLGIFDVKDNKRDLHYIGNGFNDIVNVQKVPYFDVYKNDFNNEIFKNNIINNNKCLVVELGNGKTYCLNDDFVTNYDNYKYKENDKPNDISANDYDNWVEYFCFNNRCDKCIENIADYSTVSCYYYPNEQFFAVYYTLNFLCGYEQLIKVLTEDYNYRLIQTLADISENNKYIKYKKLIEDYEEKGNPKKFLYKYINGDNNLQFIIAYNFSYVNEYKTLNEIFDKMNNDLKFKFTKQDYEKILDSYLINNFDDDVLLEKIIENNEVYYKIKRFGKFFKRERK